MYTAVYIIYLGCFVIPRAFIISLLRGKEKLLISHSIHLLVLFLPNLEAQKTTFP